MSFNQAAINTLISNISSGAKQLGIFQQVLTHDPKSAPQHDMTLAIRVESIKPSTKFSGLNGTAGIVTFGHRIYVNFLSKPEDQIDGKLLNAVSVLINEYSNEFSFGGTVIAVDLLGADSPGLSSNLAYIPDFDHKAFRIATLTVPVIIDNLWTQTP